ncbi:MAG TPA: DUF6174 domain-containing protein [Rubricoccaceae bacterium]|nr:DUF6174 domain-containing protein [Rubricoccaceae bacterium]
MHLRALLLAAPAALLLIGCDTGSDDVSGPIDPPAAVNLNALVQDTTEAGLALYRARWNAQGVEDYRFDLLERCICLRHLYRYRVAVRDGRPVQMEVTREEEEVPIIEPRPPDTVEEIFALLQDAFDGDTTRVFVGYVPETGLPAALYIDYNVRIADEELDYTITAFEAD